MTSFHTVQAAICYVLLWPCWIACCSIDDTHYQGDIILFRGLGNNILVLSSLEAISDLLDKRGSIYSHRPSLVVTGRSSVGFNHAPRRSTLLTKATQCTVQASRKRQLEQEHLAHHLAHHYSHSLWSMRFRILKKL